MAKINSRTKGNRAEREASKWWSSWTSREFGRIPGSGSLRWKKTDNITGDITCTDPKHSRKFPFSIEVKCYKDICFEHVLLEKKTSKINQFWNQACNDAERAGKHPWLMMKYNGMAKGEWFICITNNTFKKLGKISKGKHISTMGIYTGEIELIILRASQVVKEIDYKSFYKLMRKR